MLQSAEQSHSERSSNRSSGWHAGVAVSYGQNGFALGFTGGGNYGRGYGNGDELTHRHSRIGSAGSRTVIQSSGDTTLKGAQVKGRGVALSAQNLNIESLQDSAVYRSKQQNLSGSVTVGYGFSGSAGYNQSKINAEHRSVSRQSGIFAGDEGFQVKVDNHTGLKGGIITSTEAAEQNGRNRFQTAALTRSDLENFSRYEGDSFGLGVSGSISGQSLGQSAPETGSRLQPVAGKNSIGGTMGYGSDGGSRSSVTRSGIGTRNIVIGNDTDGTQAAAAYTATRSETAKADSGRLNNAFDKNKVQREMDLQREITQEFGKNAAQGVAQLSDYLGNTQDFQRAEMLKSAIGSELAQTQDAQRREALQQASNQVEGYLEANRSRYETWKEGGIGRSILHGAVGGLTTGGIGGALGAGGASAAAPYLGQAAEKLGPSGKAVADTVGGAAVGYVLGGNAGALTGANADWNNRQLHPSEYAVAKQYAAQIAAELSKREKRNVSPTEAEARIVRQMLRNVDYATAKADLFKRDDNIVSLMGSYLPQKDDKNYYDAAYNSQYNTQYRAVLNNANRYRDVGRTPKEITKYNRNVVTDIPKAAVNVGIGVYEAGANLLHGAVLPEDPAYAHIARVPYGIPEYGQALENMGNLGLGAYALSKGIQAGLNTEAKAIGQRIILQNNYYEVAGMKISKQYYERLWQQGRPAPFVQAREVLKSNPKILPDSKPGFNRYESSGLELIYNPKTGEIWHIQPKRGN